MMRIQESLASRTFLAAALQRVPRWKENNYLNPPRVWNLGPLTIKNRPRGWNLTPLEGLDNHYIEVLWLVWCPTSQLILGDWCPSTLVKSKLVNIYIYIPGTPRPTICKWLFQLDDSQSLHRKWLEITKHLFINCCLGFQEYIYIYLLEKKTHIR